MSAHLTGAEIIALCTCRKADHDEARCMARIRAVERIVAARVAEPGDVHLTADESAQFCTCDSERRHFHAAVVERMIAARVAAALRSEEPS